MRIRPVHLLLPVALLMSGCQPGVAPHSADVDAPASDTGTSAGSEDDVIVSTNEPFWQASVEGSTLVLRGIDSPERRFVDARESMTADGRRIDASDAGGSVVLLVRRMRCEDDMSGARFPMTGLLTIDGRGPFRGCARPAAMALPTPPDEEEGADASLTIPERFLGRWDTDPDACKAGGSDMTLRVEPGALRFHESIGIPTSVRALDDDAVRIDADYEGEGQVWTTGQIIRLEGPDTLFIGDEAGKGARRVRCVD